MMKRSHLNRGITFVLIGICFILAAVFTESAFDGLLWGFAGGALGPGIGMIIEYFYWSAPGNKERYREIREQEEINLQYLFGLFVFPSAVGNIAYRQLRKKY